MKTMKWLLRREFWEHKGGFFWAPVIAGGVFLAINAMVMLAASAAAGRANLQLGAIRFDQLLRNVDPEAMRAIGVAIDATTLMSAGLVMSVTAVVVFFYSIGALFEERRDRSVLFWKSLPVSDRETVLSKALAAALIAPAIGLAAGIATALLQQLLIGVFALFHGQNIFGLLFLEANPLRAIMLLVAMLPVWALWALPTIGWLMLVSVWAKSKPFLWAVIVPIGAGILVAWFDLMRTVALPDVWFWKHIVGRLLLSIVPGGWLDWDQLEMLEDGNMTLSQALTFGDMYAPLASADLWIGAAAGIAMLVAAMRLRRWRDDG